MGAGAEAPALEAHGSHSLSISIFVLAFQECRWSDALAIDRHSDGRRHGAGMMWGWGCNKLMAPVARAEHEEFTTGFLRRRAVLFMAQMKWSKTNISICEKRGWR